jgi:serine/threonine protein kinase
MAPEYAMEGVFSVKSDVFSLGVLVLEILSGQRNGAMYLQNNQQTLIQDVKKKFRNFLHQTLSGKKKSRVFFF